MKYVHSFGVLNFAESNICHDADFISLATVEPVIMIVSNTTSDNKKVGIMTTQCLFGPDYIISS